MMGFILYTRMDSAAGIPSELWNNHQTFLVRLMIFLI